LVAPFSNLSSAYGRWPPPKPPLEKMGRSEGTPCSPPVCCLGTHLPPLLLPPNRARAQIQVTKPATAHLPLCLRCVQEESYGVWVPPSPRALPPFPYSCAHGRNRDRARLGGLQRASEHGGSVVALVHVTDADVGGTIEDPTHLNTMKRLLHHVLRRSSRDKKRLCALSSLRRAPSARSAGCTR
jgi:hypothetical protein